MGDGRRASAGAGRRTSEQRRAPGAEGGAFVVDGSGDADRDQDDEGRGYRNRNYSMENNAEGAVIGVGFKGMGVRHLNDGEQSKQDDAEDRRGHGGTGLDEKCLASSLLEFLQSGLQPKDTQIWTL